MRRSHAKVIVVCALSLLLLAANRQATLTATTPHYRLDGVSVGQASGGNSAGPSYRLSATIGQMGASTTGASAHYQLCQGRQCVPPALNNHLYLPVVRR